MKKIIFHIDVNNAFLSWEAVYQLQHGNKVDIRKIPSVIGGDMKSRNGIVLAKSPVAKKMGIKSAETIYLALKKVPNLKVFPPNFWWYEKQSKELFNYLLSIFDKIEIASIDECYVDYTSFKKIYGDEVEFAYKIKDYVRNKFGFTINIGIANSKICAKMASDLEKPDKVHTIYEEEISTKMHPLPIGDLYMLGKKANEKLQLLQIKTIGELANSSVGVLEKILKKQGRLLYNYANGIDDRKVEYHNPQNEEISISRTTSEDLTTTKECLLVYQKLTNELTKRLQLEKKYTGLIGINYKTNLFKTYSKQQKLVNVTNNEAEIFKIVKNLFENCYNDEKVRNLGIKFCFLSKKQNEQLSIFSEKQEKNDNADVLNTIEKINEKFGKKVIYVPKVGEK